MRRVVVTGMGIVSPIGNTPEEGRGKPARPAASGITRSESYAEHGFRSCVHGVPDHRGRGPCRQAQPALHGAGGGLQLHRHGPRHRRCGAGRPTRCRTSARGSSWVRADPRPRTSSPPSTPSSTRARPSGWGPFMVTRCMSSTNSACLATPFGIKGVNYSITSACTTSAALLWATAWSRSSSASRTSSSPAAERRSTGRCPACSTAMGAMSSKYNDAPETASRPYDATRDGFVIAGGAGVVVLEERERAIARGAKIYGEVTGYGATSDGADMVAPSGEGRRTGDAPGAGPDARGSPHRLHQRPRHLDARGRHQGGGRGAQHLWRGQRRRPSGRPSR